MMTSTAESPPVHHHNHHSVAGMSSLTHAESLPASPSKSPPSSAATAHYSDPSTAMAAAVQSPSTLSAAKVVHAPHLDPMADEDADPMLAAAYLLSFMREQGANVAAKPRLATVPAAASSCSTSANDPLPTQSQQDVVMHTAEADTPVLEPTILPGLPSTMDLGDPASQPTSLLVPPSSSAMAATSSATASSPNAPRLAAPVAPATGSGYGKGVLIPSTTKKSSTRCKSLPSVLEYPDYLIPLNAPIQHKTASNLSLSQSAATNLTSLPEEPASLASASVPATMEAPSTPGRTSRKRPRTAPGAAAASSDEGDLAMDGLSEQDDATAVVKRVRVGVASMAMDQPLDQTSRGGSPTLDLTDMPPFPTMPSSSVSSSSSSSQQGSARGRKPSSRRSGAPASATAAAALATAASTASTSNSSASQTPTTTPQLGRPSTTLAAAAKAANEAFLKEVVPDLSSLDPKEAKRVRNTLSARASRARKAAKIEFLETRVNDLEAMIDVVVDENAMLRRMLADAGVQGVPEPSWAKMPGAAPWPEQFRDSAPLFIGAQCGVASGSGGEEAEAAGAEGQEAGPKKRGTAKSSCKGKGATNGATDLVSLSAPGSVDGDVHMDDSQQFALAPGVVAYPQPSLTAPVALPSGGSSPASTTSQSCSSLSSNLPPIAAVVGDLPYPPVTAPRFPPPLQPQQQQMAGLPAGVYQPTFAYPARTPAASALSSQSASPIHAAFPPPTAGPSTSR